LNGRIIETPGHSLDSISVVFDDGDCFVGDAAANLPQFLGTKYCVILIEDLEAYYTSWRKLISEGARQVFPAHGKPFPAEKLEQNIYKNSGSQMVMIS
jgi:glyoxylase-like metal-dependent hydrolase (beta-lactamase superfamily II)